jgi:hypothetical protein
VGSHITICPVRDRLLGTVQSLVDALFEPSAPRTERMIDRRSAMEQAERLTGPCPEWWRAATASGENHLTTG